MEGAVGSGGFLKVDEIWATLYIEAFPAKHVDDNGGRKLLE